MTRRDLRDLLLLAALWGASFLFMRLSAGAFGPLALMFVRVAGATLFLAPLLLWRGEAQVLRQHWRALLLVGLLNSALPFVLFGLAALTLSAALMGVLNAAAPIWTTLVAWAWLGDKPGAARWAGLVLGIAGVAGLAWGRLDFKPGDHGVSPALGMGACVLATLAYGVAANVSRRRLAGVPPIAVAAGSQASAALLLLVPALWAWPASAPSTSAWASAAALAVLCTGVAYVLFFRLIARTGAANAVSVTLLIPMFAMAWGWLFLGEQPTPGMLGGCALILLGTALSTGLLKLPAARAGASSGPPASS
jgi:drug/metabolite transporter (DMT)-like permease